ncbi:D-alanyl-D-alanine carboxypeptidase family protein [Microbacterium stercoris]|uniref:D-alanyl-D-alanine carboxypeptidase n=1 Tax=Microbacterium stercoris TaxID=2820289 RepID=A0A939QI95_9MICO|nr:D-alanyl-D-alanine carboxypeptidase [Microbacterium stercoris]MBO3662570.1 D-alanyl-D-alanine carboxypeptidase [Microbacterium stercoris]
MSDAAASNGSAVDLAAMFTLEEAEIAGPVAVTAAAAATAPEATAAASKPTPDDRVPDAPKPAADAQPEPVAPNPDARKRPVPRRAAPKRDVPKRDVPVTDARRADALPQAPAVAAPLPVSAGAPAAPADPVAPVDEDATQAFDVAALIAAERAGTPAPGTKQKAGRRARREATTVAALLEDAAPKDPDASAPEAADTPDSNGAQQAEPVPTRTAALTWVTPETLGTPIQPTGGKPVITELLPPAPGPRKGLALAAPLLTAAALGLGYFGGCALWPLANVEPTVSEATVESLPGKPLGIAWPQDGTAAVGAEGLGLISSSDSDAASMASITKLVTTLMILERAPLAAGEDGPSYSFTWEDSNLYWQYRYQNESALDVPVDGSLTERQMIEGILIGSANNYIDRLTTELWGSKEDFVAAVPAWLEAHGLSGIKMVDASGIDPDNTATASDLVKLASLALADPTIAQIVALPSVELPGAGEVANTNPLLGDPGVVGVKTGTLLAGWREQWNLLTAKDITIGQTTVRVYAAVLGQPDEDGRAIVSRQLLDQVEQSLQLQPSVPVGTTVATVTTEWGASAEVVTTADAQVVLWDSGTAAVTSDYEVEVGDLDGADVGQLTATGPFDSTDVPLALEGSVPGPSLKWRLTHPLDLLGLQ